MTTLAEQSNVPSVVMRNIVGIPDFAVMVRGEYPPFARIAMTCVPFTTEIAVEVSEDALFVLGFKDTSQNANPMTVMLTAREARIRTFIEVKN